MIIWTQPFLLLNSPESVRSWMHHEVFQLKANVILPGMILCPWLPVFLKTILKLMHLMTNDIVQTTANWVKHIFITVLKKKVIKSMPTKFVCRNCGLLFHQAFQFLSKHSKILVTFFALPKRHIGQKNIKPTLTAELSFCNDWIKS